MKKYLLLTVAAFTVVFTACEKDEFEALSAQTELEIEALRAESQLGDSQLAQSIEDFKAIYDAFVIEINAKVDAAVAALEAADDALEAYINSEIDDLSDKLDAYVAELNKSIKENTDLIKATGTELRLKLEAEAAARVAGDLELENELAEQVAKLDSIDARNLQLIYGNLRSISAANARITAEAQASVARDADLQSGINSNTLAISAVASRTSTLEASVATNVADINQNLLDIASNDGEILAHNTRIADLRTELDAAVVAANTLRGRVDLLNSHAGRIATLETEVAALELAVAAQSETDGNHASTLQTIQTSITNLRGSLETFATDGDTAVSNAIGLEITRIDGLLAGLRTDVDANNRQIVWQNSLIAGLTIDVQGLQAGSISLQASGTTLTLTVSGTQMTYDIDQSGGSDGSHGTNGAPGSNGADGADGLGIASTSYDAATGILTINFTDSTSFSTGDLRGAVGPQGPAGPQGAQSLGGSGEVTYGTWTPAFDANTPVGELIQSTTATQGPLSGTVTRSIIVSSSALSPLTADEATEGDLNGDGDALDMQSISRTELSVASVSLGDAITETFIINGTPTYSDNSYDVRAYSAFGEWTGAAPAAVVTSGTVTVSLETAASNVAEVTQTTTTEQISTVAAYDQTRTRTVTNAGGNFDPNIAELPLSETRTVEAVSTVIAPLVVEVEVANPDYDSSTVYVDRQYSAFGEWTGTAPAGTVEVVSDYAGWVGTAPASTLELVGTPVITFTGAGANRMMVTTTQREIVVPAYQQTNTRQVRMVVAAYDQTRTRTILNAGANFDPNVAELPLSETRTVSASQGAPFADVDTRTIPEARTAAAPLVETVAAPEQAAAPSAWESAGVDTYSDPAFSNPDLAGYTVGIFFDASQNVYAYTVYQGSTELDVIALGHATSGVANTEAEALDLAYAAIVSHRG